MAAPLFLALPAIFSALWAGLIAIFRWALEHAHIVKFVIVSVIIIVAFRLGVWAYSWVVGQFNQYIETIDSHLPNGVSVSIDLLAKVNYCLPVSEALGLLSVFITLCGSCLALRGLLLAYRSIPFKGC